jgi:hypothetical protein
MFKKIQTEMSAFERYFREADDNEDTISVKVAPRKNRGTDYGDDTNRIKVAPHESRGTNYSATDDDTEDATIDDASTTDIADGPTTGEDDGTDYNADDTTDDTDVDDNPDDDTDDTTDDGPDTGDDGTDYNDDSDDASDSTDDSQDDSNDEPEETEEEKNEKIKKFHMYKRFLRLYNSIDSFLEKIQDVVKNDATQNAVIKTVTNNLKDIHDAMYDYMTIRYKSQSYVQILIYFETVISIVKLNFELLRNNKINLKQ